jgi:hypothetical protein
MVLLNGHDPFSGEKGMCPPFVTLGDDVQRRDTS